MKQFIHFIPGANGRLSTWAANYKAKIALHGPALGLSAEDITKQQTAAQGIVDTLNKIEQKKSELGQASTAKKLFKDNEFKMIRGAVSGYKKVTGYTEDIGRELGVVATNVNVVTEELKPSARLKTEPGLVKVFFNKRKMYGATIFSRLQGVADWTELSSEVTSPYIDRRPLAEPGKPELREYMVRCYDGRIDIGQHSDVTSIVFGG
jgi:hypothetical protein